MAKPDAAGSTAKKTEIIVARFIVDPFFRREGLGSDGCDLFNVVVLSLSLGDGRAGRVRRRYIL
jgi:hypothetical protein